MNTMKPILSEPMQVIMLPTDKDIKTRNLVKLPNGNLQVMTETDMLDYLASESNAIKARYLYLISDTPIYEGDLLIINECEIGQCIKVVQGKHPFVVKSINGHEYVYKQESLKKIIATTDSSLLPKKGNEPDIKFEDLGNDMKEINQSFVEAYTESNGSIKEVRVEMEEYPLNNCEACNENGVSHCAYPEECEQIKIGTRIKTRPNNTVIIHYDQLTNILSKVCASNKRGL